MIEKPGLNDNCNKYTKPKILCICVKRRIYSTATEHATTAIIYITKSRRTRSFGFFCVYDCSFPSNSERRVLVVPSKSDETKNHRKITKNR